MLNRVKKVILLMILVLTALFITIEKEEFFIDKEYSASESMKDPETGEKKDPLELSLEGSVSYEQGFIARENEIFKVRIDFKAWEQKNGKGKIIVSIKDKNGEVLATAEKKISSLTQSKQSTETVFSVPAQLVKGEEYVLVIQSQGIKSAKGCYLYGLQEKGKTFTDLTIDGESSDSRIKVTFIMNHFAANSRNYMYGLLLMAAIFVLIPFDLIDQKLKKINNRIPSLNVWLSRIFFFASVPLSFFIMQRYSGYGVGNFIRLSMKLKGLTNYLLYGLIWWIIYLVVNRTRLTAVIMVAFSSFLGLVNYFVWNFRGIPIMAADVMSVGTAMDVAEHYEYTLNLNALWALALTITFICVTLSLKGYKGLNWKKRICVAIAFLIPYGVFYTQLLHGTLMKDHGITVSVWEPQRNYATNGSLLSFFLSYTYYVVDKPSDYSVEKVEKIAGQYSSDPAEPTEETRPNVIAIMNEAYADLTIDGELETTEDFMPYVRSLTENTVKGDLYVSVLAGNTANTEFEFLTGCSMAFLPFRSIPYDSYIKGEFPSLTQLMKADGYAGNIAIHPGAATSWNRDVVYEDFGFEEFFVANDMEDKEYIRNFVSDETDFDFIIRQYEETRKTTEEPFYAFNVTIQNHGGYAASQGLIDTPIDIVNDNLQNEAAEQYINLIKETDVAFEKLLTYFEQVDEPTVIVMFGDHQPSLGTSYYEKLFGKKTEEFTLEDTFREYTVPYVIWANYDIEEEEVDMSANFLSAYLMKVIDGQMSGYQKYLLELMKEVPLITANGYRGADGVAHELDEKSEYSEAVHDYQVVQYNNMFDTKNRVEDFYKLQ